jgi:hypothetical protein
MQYFLNCIKQFANYCEVQANVKLFNRKGREDLRKERREKKGNKYQDKSFLIRIISKALCKKT